MVIPLMTSCRSATIKQALVAAGRLNDCSRVHLYKSPRRMIVFAQVAALWGEACAMQQQVARRPGQTGCSPPCRRRWQDPSWSCQWRAQPGQGCVCRALWIFASGSSNSLRKQFRCIAMLACKAHKLSRLRCVCMVSLGWRRRSQDPQIRTTCNSMRCLPPW